MADPAKGVSTESMLNSLLSETVWGAVIIPGYNKQTSATGHGAVDTIMRTPLGLDGRTLRPEDWVLLSPKPHPYPPTLTETHNIAFDGATEGRDHDDFIVPIDYAMQRLKDHERSRHHIHEKGDDLVNSSATGHERDIDVEDIVIITFAEYIENIVSRYCYCLFDSIQTLMITYQPLFVAFAYTVETITEGPQRPKDPVCDARRDGGAMPCG
jgi:hypothetical protein